MQADLTICCIAGSERVFPPKKQKPLCVCAFMQCTHREWWMSVHCDISSFRQCSTTCQPALYFCGSQIDRTNERWEDFYPLYKVSLGTGNYASTPNSCQWFPWVHLDLDFLCRFYFDWPHHFIVYRVHILISTKYFMTFCKPYWKKKSTIFEHSLFSNMNTECSDMNRIYVWYTYMQNK